MRGAGNALLAGIVAFVLGAGAGVLGAYFFGTLLFEEPFWVKKKEGPAGTPPQGGGMGMGGMGMMKGMAKGGGGMGKGGGMAKGGGFRGLSSKTYLANLVAKLDLLTSPKKPLTLNLSAEEKEKIREQLQGLEEHDKLADDEAKQRLDAILEVLKEHRRTLEDAGYRWPSSGFQIPREHDNPFREEEPEEHLKALRENLKK